MKDFQELWAEWEQKRNMFAMVFESCYLWEYIRYNVFIIVSRKIKYVNDTYYYYIPSNKSKKKLEFSDLYFKKKDLLFFNMSRRQTVGDELCSPFLDGLVEELEYSYYVLEIRNKEEQSNKIKTPNIKYLDLNKFACNYEINKKYILYGNKIIKLLEHDFNISFSKRDRTEIYNVIASAISNRKKLYIYFKYILTLINPKAVVVLGYGLSYVGYMIEAAKQMGIPVIEYMHGVIGFSVYYARISGDSQKICPDYIFTYSGYEKKYIKFPIQKCNIIPVGNAYYEKRIKWCLNNIKETKRKKKIMYISDNIINNLVIGYLIELMGYLGEDYQLVIKIREDERWKKKYKALIDIGATVVGNYGNKDIYEYLTDINYIIGTVSTVFAEASELPVYQIMIKTKYSSSSKMYIENGFAVSYESAKDLAEDIKNDKLHIPNKKFYHSDSKISFNKALKKVINEKTKNKN